MDDNQMTRVEREFATKWHNLIYAFLNEKGLPVDDYYDIVVFGFLHAVKVYFSKPALKRFSFATIAWKKMEGELIDHYRKNARKKRSGYTISLNSSLYGDEDLSVADSISVPDRLMMQLETELLLHDLARKATHQQMAIVQLRSAGYSQREIAHSQSIPMKRVQELLNEIRDLLAVVCHE